MSFLTPRIPSQRDIEIYYAVYARQQRQADVASDKHLSQSRVSRICAAVRHWIALGKPGACQPVEAQVYLATDLWQQRLAYHELQADSAFRQTCQPPSDDKPAKPDPRLLKQAVDCAREQYQLASVMATAHRDVHRQLQEDPLYDEEMKVSQAQSTCQRTRVLHDELTRGGAQLPPLPKFDPRTVALFARNRVRREHSHDTSARRYLTPEWDAAVNAVAEAPLPYPGQEAVASTDEPAPVAACESISESTANAQAYGEDSIHVPEPAPEPAPSSVTPAAPKPCPDEPRNQHFDYTQLVPRHKSSALPPIRWHRMT